MTTWWKLLLEVTGWLAVAAFFGWRFFRALQRSDDPGAFVGKWVVTVILAGLLAKSVPLMLGSPVIGVPLVAALAIFISIIWSPSWSTWLAKPLTSAFDGGDEEPENVGRYSIAQGRRRRGQFLEAIAEIRAQLAKAPDDFAGLMLLAEIHAENLNDLQGAEIAIQKIINCPAHTAAQVAGALNTLADWQLKFGQDPDAARESLQKVVDLLPNTPQSQMAAQRMAHLRSPLELLKQHERPRIALKTSDKNLGLNRQIQDMKPPEENPAETAAKYVEHLQKHPLDSEAREILAMIYAEHYRRLDLAQDQLEQMISQPEQPAKQVVRWLNLLADLQINVGNDVVAAEQTIRRINELFPGTIYAEQATMRLEYVRLQAKRNEKSQVLKLGSYEKDLGLKKPTG